MKNRERTVKLGRVGVDSGQLMVCDPCYIASHWEKQDEEHGVYWDVFRDTETGQRWQFCPGRSSSEPDIKPFPGSFTEPILECGGLSPNELMESGRWVKDGYVPPWRGEFTYAGCCDLTCHTKDLGGEMGGGLGVAFSSGLGDGVYDVFATIVDLGPWGERVKEVRIVLLDEEEEQSGWDEEEEEED